jgi:hypothetical protein
MRPLWNSTASVPFSKPIAAIADELTDIKLMDAQETQKEDSD